MKLLTHLVYLNNPDIHAVEATIIGIVDGNPGMSIVVDQSSFYPQRGGQPSETGTIESPDAIFKVSKVTIQDNVVLHHGLFDKGYLAVGDSVFVKTDQAERILHSRIHTAGELICAAVKNLGHVEWQVSSAIHFPQQSSVEYDVVLDDPDKFRLSLASEVNQLIATDHEVRIALFPDKSHLSQSCGFIPDYILDNEPVRVVTVANGTGRPCLGTHVKRLNQIGGIVIRSVKLKKGRTVISYYITEKAGV